MGRQNLKKISVIILCLCGQPWFHVVRYYNNDQKISMKMRILPNGSLRPLYGKIS